MHDVLSEVGRFVSCSSGHAHLFYEERDLGQLTLDNILCISRAGPQTN